MVHPEGSLSMESASDGQISFYTWLQLPTKNETQLMTIKIDPGTQVNIILLSKYQKLFPHKINDSRYHKPSSLSPTAHTWMSHDSSPNPFIEHFVTKVQHAMQPKLYPTCFYVFEDSTSPQILLSSVTLERLGILEFQVPSLAATSQIDDLHVPSSPTPSSKRKTTKSITFSDPLVPPWPATQWPFTPRP